MQFSVLIAALFASAVAASPLDLPVPPEKRGGTPTSTMPGYPNPTGTPYDGCPDGLFSNPQCCATDILGVADLDCHSRKFIANPASPRGFLSPYGREREIARLTSAVLQPLPFLGALRNSVTFAQLAASEPDAVSSLSYVFCLPRSSQN